jgi:hypothetical protein
MDSTFLFLLLKDFLGFNCSCVLSALIASTRKAKDFFPGTAWASKQAFSIVLIWQLL